ncbi:MAG: hypothetical protein R2755_06765 [Acidimicrobiales bacterium]
MATRQPDHPVIDAVLHADPERWATPELERRAALRLPPVVALASIEGPAAARSPRSCAAPVAWRWPDRSMGAGW